MTESLRNPLTAKILSLFCPGLGQLYAGAIVRAIIVFCITLGTLPILIGVLVWLWNIWDAGNVADLHNQKAALKTIERVNK